MNFDLLLIPTLALALILYWAGERWTSQSSSNAARFYALLGSFVLAIPGCLIPLYYLHIFDRAKWFYEFRAFPGSELTAAGVGLFVGVVMGYTTSCFRWFRIVLGAVMVGVLCIGITLPYLKPIMWPVPKHGFVMRGCEHCDRSEGIGHRSHRSRNCQRVLHLCGWDRELVSRPCFFQKRFRREV